MESPTIPSRAQRGTESPTLLVRCRLTRTFSIFYTTTPRFAHPLQAAPAFSSSLGRVKARFPLHSLFRQLFKKKGNYPAVFQEVIEKPSPRRGETSVTPDKAVRPQSGVGNGPRVRPRHGRQVRKNTAGYAAEKNKIPPA